MQVLYTRQPINSEVFFGNTEKCPEIFYDRSFKLRSEKTGSCWQARTFLVLNRVLRCFCWSVDIKDTCTMWFSLTTHSIFPYKVWFGVCKTHLHFALRLLSQLRYLVVFGKWNLWFTNFFEHTSCGHLFKIIWNFYRHFPSSMNSICWRSIGKKTWKNSYALT